jgi:protein involved in polysaccharide export with SLBB domain
MRTSGCTLRLAALAFASLALAPIFSGADAVDAANARPPAPSQQRLTLAPGDVFTFRLYGEEQELTRKDVPIGPDGRVSYLEAQNILAAGLTVDELRDRVNEELGKFRRAPQAYIVPVAYRGRKYFVIGQVARGGAFPLDRPTTLIEAVAKAGGLETSLQLHDTGIGPADLARSFVARGTRKLPVDFEKLFLHGDLSQNIPLEPNDYIYVPAAEQGAVYVLGAVQRPGAQAFSEPTEAFEAVNERGGFTERAWRQRVLVIRGSLGRPETFVVNARNLLGGRARELQLQPRDIVYVSDRPWGRSDELLEAAIAAYIAATMAEETRAPTPSANTTEPR